jgi:arylsulfatase A
MRRALLLLTLLIPWFVLRAEETRRPNVVLILADDLGYGDLGCYGGKAIPTPNLDRMAREGMRFTQAYAGSTVCAPSRCALMTGRHTGHGQVRANTQVGPEGQQSLTSGTLTLAGVLKKAGYRTGAFGKWGLGGPGSSGEPSQMGFDEFFGYLDQALAHEYYPAMLRRHSEAVPMDGKTYSHGVIFDTALKFIRKAGNAPFFLFLPVCLPHGKLDIPDAGAFLEKPWSQPLKNYAAMVALLDRDVGRLLEVLDENTVVFFASDNGPEVVYFQKLVPEYIRELDSNGPLRGFKRDLYEGGIRVPLLVRWPGRVKPGVNGHVCAFWDLLPTLAELAGQTVPADLDGISFAPALLGRPGQKEHTHLYWEFHERGFAQAVRFGDWKAVRRGPVAAVELFNLGEDVGETVDLAGRHPDRVARALALFGTSRTDSPEIQLKSTVIRGSGYADFRDSP